MQTDEIQALAIVWSQMADLADRNRDRERGRDVQTRSRPKHADRGAAGLTSAQATKLASLRQSSAARLQPKVGARWGHVLINKVSD